ncbi:hypothetical protein [Clostridium botulinum]|uniref:hypothetical protein n=1 Tax=Clostridium botulinum TaxID=1491 RepID=UPI001E48FD9E|nr:hypothetical protein [Clostridium botulinum]MCD3277837.1 hypothetical protein [Clostridium botulinum C/D]MCD3281280.1 hypothetical protein [Clostridium botulinum C/D]
MANGKFAGGNGSKENPYLIEDAFDLNAIRNGLDKNYKLIKDINLDIKPFNEGEGWMPIGHPEQIRFSGTLDGNGKAILNLYIRNTNLDYASLIFGIEGYAEIKNLKIKNANIIGKSCSSIVGLTKDSALIGNCAVTDSKILSNSVSGGICAEIWCGGLIKNSYCTNTVEIEGSIKGGIFGCIGTTGKYETPRVINCYSNNIAGFGEMEGGLYLINDSYYNKDMCTNNKTLGYSITTEQMKKPSTFKDWEDEKLEDGTPVWILEEGRYPRLWFDNMGEYIFLKQNNKIYSINPQIYKDNILPKNKTKLKTVIELKNTKTIDDVLTKEDIKKYGACEVELSEKLLKDLQGCEIIKWTDDKKDNELNISGEYKDKIFKCFEETELLVWIDDKDVNKVSLIGEIESTKILDKAEDYDLLMWTDDKNIKEAKITYETEPYRPIDALKTINEGEFNVLVKELEN